MEKYIGVKQIEAEPMALGDARKLLGRKISPASPVNKKGYLVKYPDGYMSWSPRDTFQKAYRQIGNENNSITNNDVDDFIVSLDAVKMGDKTMVVSATLANGFVIAESSSCVDPENFDAKRGCQICIDKIKNKVWELLGFLQQSAINGIN